MSAVTLTSAQAVLLGEIREAGTLYIKRYGRYYRTVRALERKGLVVCLEPDYSLNGQDGWTVHIDGDIRVQ